jgi:zinc transporter ZupT
VATGLGAVPFAFAKHPTRRWLGASNAVAAGLMLAASFNLVYEGMNYGPLRSLAGALLGLGFAAGAMIWMVFSELVPDALEEASSNLVAVVVTLSVVAMVAFQVLIR